MPVDRRIHVNGDLELFFGDVVYFDTDSPIYADLVLRGYSNFTSNSGRTAPAFLVSGYATHHLVLDSHLALELITVMRAPLEAVKAFRATGDWQRAMDWLVETYGDERPWLLRVSAMMTAAAAESS